MIFDQNWYLFIMINLFIIFGFLFILFSYRTIIENENKQPIIINKLPHNDNQKDLIDSVNAYYKDHLAFYYYISIAVLLSIFILLIKIFDNKTTDNNTDEEKN